MKLIDAVRALNDADRQGNYVFAKSDLRQMFPDDSGQAFESGLRRLTGDGVLLQPAPGVYVYAFSRHEGDTLEAIAAALRSGEYNYLSLESALSEYGVILQTPADRITVMTTGDPGEYKTPFGVIEFTHNPSPPHSVIEDMVDRGTPLRLARKEAAWRDLKMVGRNTHLADQEMLHEYGLC